MKAIRSVNGKCYLISTENTFDRGWETMIFESEPQPDTDNGYDVNFDLIDWAGLWSHEYPNSIVAAAGHRTAVKGIESGNLQQIWECDYDE